MKNFFLIVFYSLLFLGINKSFSQKYIRTAEFSAHNPTTFEMTRFDLTPVNKYVGKADVSIPLYTMDFDGKQIPFTLSYDTGGIRVAQEASWVGLGWNLSGIPTITHIINQASDIGQGRPGYGGEGGLSTGYCFEPALPFHHSGFDLQELSQGPPYTLTSLYDTQPDVFIATLYSSTVIFQLTQKAVTDGIIKARILNDSNAQIDFQEDTRTFVITDESGFVYHFSHMELTSQIALGDSLMGEGEPEPEDIFFQNGDAFNTTIDANIPKAWYPDKIISPNAKELKFTYYGKDEGRDGYYHVSMPTFSQSRSVVSCAKQMNNGTFDGSNYPDPFGTYSAVISRVGSVIPKEIINLSTGKRVVFNTSSRFDLVPLSTQDHHPLSLVTGSYSGNEELLKLSRLDVFSSTGEVVKHIVFDNDSYFNAQHANDAFPQKNLRLKLDGVSVDGLEYAFEYDSPNQLPKKNSIDVDFWGFYNNAGNSVRYPRIALNGDFCQIDTPDFVNPNPSINGGKLGSKFGTAKKGSLKRVTYPTGGYTTYTYESNTASVSLDDTSERYDPFSYYYLNENNLEAGYPLVSSRDPNLKTFKIGGLRISKVKNFDHTGSLLLEKTYRYESTENSSLPVSKGRLMSKLYHFDTYYEFTEGGNVQWSRLETSSSNKLGILNSANGSHVGYDRVEEIIESNLDNATNGKRITEYINTPSPDLTDVFNGFQFEIPPYHYANANGRVLKEMLLDKQNLLVRKIENSYELFQNPVGNGYKIMYGSITDFLLAIPTQFNPPVGIYPYPIRKFVPQLTETKTTEFLNGDSFTSTTRNTYNLRNRLRSTSQSLSHGVGTNTDKVEFYYPYDTEYNVSRYLRMNDLRLRNRIEAPVYVRRYRDNRFVGHEFQSFNFFSSSPSLLLPAFVHYQKGDAPLEDIEERMRYDAYDSFGNLTEMTVDNSYSTKYVYGYEGDYPIAQIHNAPATQDGATPINEIIDTHILQNPETQFSEVNTEIQRIKNHSEYEQSQIETYAYEPGVGMVWNSSRRDYTHSFSYDLMERLTAVRDNSAALISENAYNVLNEGVPCTNCSHIVLKGIKYKFYNTESITITRRLPSGIPPITHWRLEAGDGTTLDQGTGALPGSFSFHYTTLGMLNVRLYAYFGENSFVTGNTNIRILKTPPIPGEDVRIENVVTVSDRKRTARIYGSPGSDVSYTFTLQGPRGDQSGTVQVGGTSSTIASYQTKTAEVTIPASGYVNCSLEFKNAPSGIISGTISFSLKSTSIGQLGSPASFNVNCCY
ncbi:hypothetical protein [Spongiimicrobium salis]|uniref:hypothetical protein n=1 Tax=Spongiimicrobium salis TaxID=1667022 RepID=UPI00374CF661